MDWEPEGAREKLGAGLGFDDRCVKGDLAPSRPSSRTVAARSAPGAATSEEARTDRVGSCSRHRRPLRLSCFIGRDEPRSGMWNPAVLTVSVIAI